MQKIQLLLSTRNAHKLAEVARILDPYCEVLSLDFLPGFPEVEETGETFEDNARLKAEAASLRFSGLVLADDSGLEVDALQGAPGVRSARFAGDDATDQDNNRLLLERIGGVKEEERTARFRCVLAVARGGQTMAVFSGAVEGRLLTAPRGETGFGYDPLFVPNGQEQTFAELGADVKNHISHRAQALAKLREWLSAA
jgi:XTP/dITP diphosphohydrolase